MFFPDAKELFFRGFSSPTWVRNFVSNDWTDIYTKSYKASLVLKFLDNISTFYSLLEDNSKYRRKSLGRLQWGNKPFSEIMLINMARTL